MKLISASQRLKYDVWNIALAVIADAAEDKVVDSVAATFRGPRIAPVFAPVFLPIFSRVKEVLKHA